MEEQWQADRARLRKLRQAHPTWSQRKLAEETKRSVTWVKKWCAVRILRNQGLFEDIVSRTPVLLIPDTRQAARGK